jgi:hypothetical protein
MKENSAALQSHSEALRGFSLGPSAADGATIKSNDGEASGTAAAAADVSQLDATRSLQVQHFQPGFGALTHSCAVPPPALLHVHFLLPVEPGVQDSTPRPMAAAAWHVLSQSLPLPQLCVQ